MRAASATGSRANSAKRNVFMDVDNLFAGQRFDQELDKALTQCEVLVAVIGRNWMDCSPRIGGSAGATMCARKSAAH